MKKWCIIDSLIFSRGLEEITAFNSKEETLEAAQSEWDSLSDHDKKDRDSYIVGLCNVEEYKPGCWQYAEDESGNIDTDIYEIAKRFK